MISTDTNKPSGIDEQDEECYSEEEYWQAEAQEAAERMKEDAVWEKEEYNSVSDEDDCRRSLSKADFELLDSVGLSWVTSAYNNDYAVYLREHAKDVKDDWFVMDPFHRGLTVHPYEMEYKIAKVQGKLKAAGMSLLKANDTDGNYFVDSFYE